VQNFTEFVAGEPFRRGVKCTRGSKIEQCWMYRRLLSHTYPTFGYLISWWVFCCNLVAARFVY